MWTLRFYSVLSGATLTAGVDTCIYPRVKIWSMQVSGLKGYIQLYVKSLQPRSLPDLPFTHNSRI